MSRYDEARCQSMAILCGVFDSTLVASQAGYDTIAMVI